MQKELGLLESAGLAVPPILLPDENKCDYEKWAVVACDQFTSRPAYWKDAERIIGASPSTLQLILPEIYLADNFSERIDEIHRTMSEYLGGGVFKAPFKGFILTERKMNESARSEFIMVESARSERNMDNGVWFECIIDKSIRLNKSRWGLIAAIDLEAYSFEPGAKTLIRSTEETAKDRLPPRIEIRRGAALETPHILVLADDPGRTLIEPLAAGACSGRYEKAYDFGLMAGGGHIRGYYIGEAEEREAASPIRRIADAIHALLQKAKADSPDPILFAVGDGNHSLAAAKTYWDEVKATLPESSASNHPLRYALVEILNLHSDAVKFEPIHRALFNADPQTVIGELHAFFAQNGITITYGGSSTAQAGPGAEAAIKPCAGNPASEPQAGDVSPPAHEFEIIYGGGKTAVMRIGNPKTRLPAATLQEFIDVFCEKHPNVRLDYIHGRDELARLAAEEGCFCFAAPPVDKNGFFAYIASNGPMPRKSFSMGEAHEKRYYLESRKLAP